MKYFQLLAIPAFFFFQCQSNTETQSEVLSELPTTNIPIDADTLALDFSQSIITWVGSKPTGQHDGTIGLKNGLVLWYEDECSGWRSNY